MPLAITWDLLRQYHNHRLRADSPSGCGGCRPGRPCEVGNSLLAIDPEGNVMPCHQFLYRPQDWLGTAEAPDLGERRRPYVELTSQDLLGCLGCAAEPVCGGGCRVVALRHGQGLQGVHEGHCLVTRAHARAVFRVYDTLMKERNVTFQRELARTS